MAGVDRARTVSLAGAKNHSSAVIRIVTSAPDKNENQPEVKKRLAAMNFFVEFSNGYAMGDVRRQRHN